MDDQNSNFLCPLHCPLHHNINSLGSSVFLSICRSKAFIERVLTRCFSVLNIILLLFAWKLLFKSSSFNSSFSSVFFTPLKHRLWYFKTYQWNIWKLGNKQATFKMTILPETFRWRLNGNTLANPKKWYHWWHCKKRLWKTVVH